MKQMISRYDVHLCNYALGHLPSEDCWCEPCRSYWVRGNDGRMLHVLEHNDTLDPSVHNDWINQVLGQ